MRKQQNCRDSTPLSEAMFESIGFSLFNQNYIAVFLLVRRTEIDGGRMFYQNTLHIERYIFGEIRTCINNIVYVRSKFLELFCAFFMSVFRDFVR